MLGRLLLIAFLGASFDLGAGLRKLRHSLLAARQFVGNRQAIRDVGLVRSFRPRQQFSHFRLQLLGDLAGMLIRQGAVPAGVGVDLRAVQRNRAHPQHPHLARQFQHLHKQPLDLLEKPPAKRCDRVVVGMVVGGYKAERHRM